MSDLTLSVDGHLLNLRVGAVIIHEEKVLVCRTPGHDWCFLPGGRVKINESSQAAMRRELKEELGAKAELLGVLVCSENFFAHNGLHHHEICTYYQARWTGEAPNGAFKPADQGPELLEWVAKSDLETANLKPDFMIEQIRNPLAKLQLIINQEN